MPLLLVVVAEDGGGRRMAMTGQSGQRRVIDACWPTRGSGGDLGGGAGARGRGQRVDRHARGADARFAGYPDSRARLRERFP